MPADPYFTDQEALAYLDTNGHDDEALADARAIVESRFEQICGVAFVVREATETHSGDGGTELRLRHPKVRSIVSASSDGETVDVAGAKPTVLGAYLATGWPAGTRNLAVTYEHGFDGPPPEVKRAALRYLKEVLRTGGGMGPTDDRAIRIDLESGSYQRAVAGDRRPTGIPDVDVALRAYDFHVPFSVLP
jgi:hypothetical protein